MTVTKRNTGFAVNGSAKELEALLKFALAAAEKSTAGVSDDFIFHGVGQEMIAEYKTLKDDLEALDAKP